MGVTTSSTVAATYEPIATQTLGSATATVTFSSISGSWTDLILISYATVSTTGNNVLKLQYNNDGGNNYSVTRLYGDGTTASTDRFSNQTWIDSGYLPGTLNSGYGISIAQIMNYSNQNTFKSTICRWSSLPSTNEKYVAALTGLWRNTNAINRIDLSFVGGNINSGSTFTLYGIKSA